MPLCSLDGSVCSWWWWCWVHRWRLSKAHLHAMKNIPDVWCFQWTSTISLDNFLRQSRLLYTGQSWNLRKEIKLYIMENMYELGIVLKLILKLIWIRYWRTKWWRHSVYIFMPADSIYKGLTNMQKTGNSCTVRLHMMLHVLLAMKRNMMT